MANPEHVEILKKGAEVWNRWRGENPSVVPDLEGVELWEVNLWRVDLQGAKLDRSNLQGADLQYADLQWADLRGVNLQGAELQQANLLGVNLKQADLKQADFKQANLQGADLQGVKLQRAKLQRSNLERAKLQGANLRGVEFQQANLLGVNLMRANLQGADFQGANLLRATLRATNLNSVNFTQVSFGGTGIDNVNLSQCQNLESCYHETPSGISTATFKKSKGQIPIEFLRGCGLSDWEIESVKLYQPNLSNQEIIDINYRIIDIRMTQAIQINPLFISYSHADAAFVDKIGEALTEKGVRYWRDIRDAKAGKLERQVDQAMRLNPIVLIVLSETSTNSDWVEYEAGKARKLEKELGRDVLCPIAIDDSWKDCDWPGRLRTQIENYNILPFNGWEDQEVFDRMFGKLLGGLDLFYKK